LFFSEEAPINAREMFKGKKEQPQRVIDQRWMHEVFSYTCQCVSGAICCLLMAYIVYLFFLWKTADFDPQTTCYLVDMFEHHVPGRHVKHHGRPPLTAGKICFNYQQLLVWWEVHEGFSDHFTLTDFKLRGPLPIDRQEKQVGPTALALGLRGSGGAKHERQKFWLRGSNVIERSLCNEILSNPHRYYLEFEGIPNDEHGGARQEIARSRLDKKATTTTKQ
jgi:hypothetical protein